MRRVAIFDPVEEARALAFHMGREGGGQRPRAGAIEVAADLHAAEVECLMAQTPKDAPIKAAVR